MTRRGKIARLPNPLREQINHRLQNGVEAKKIAEWLNTLPEVRRLLHAEFDGQPINENNLSNWKLGGYRDWVNLQESLEAVRRFGADAAELKKAGGAQLTDQLALCLTARIGVALQQQPGDADDAATQLGQLRHFFADLVDLRKGDHDAQRLRLERERIDLERRKFNHKTAYERMELEDERHPGRRAVTKETLDRAAAELKLL